MKCYLTICTKLYYISTSTMLIKLKKLKVIDELFENGYYFVLISYKQSHELEILNLLKNIIINENQLVKNSKNLKSYVNKIIFDEEEKNIELDFFNFIINNKVLNIEGYLNFKLKEVIFKINLLLYSTIKNLIE